MRINGNEFLFDVARDPLERANLKRREPRRFAELKQAWTTWNKAMLPFDPKSDTGGFDATELADHFGVAPVDD